MELVKPEPLILDGRAHYTLTSYDPVSVEVEVPRTTDDDVELAVQATVMQAGGGPAELYNDTWIRKQFEGVSDARGLRDAVREQLAAMQAHVVEEQKAGKCAEELAKRLVQRVPTARVAQLRASVVQSFAASLAQDGLTEAQFLAHTGMRKADLETMFDREAQTSAEHEAAIDAWASHRRLQVAEDEIAGLLGLTPEDASELIEQARRVGQQDQIRQAALRSKAMGLIVAECNCTYRHETAEEAAARVEQMRQERQAFMRAMEQEDSEPPAPQLKLV